MPKSIKSEDKLRMFPFEFYEELSDNMTTHKLLNPAFMLKDNPNDNKSSITARKELFNAPINDETLKLRQTLDTLNIQTIEPFNELLILEPCIKSENINTKSKAEKSQQPLSVLVVQLYDSSQQPIFAQNVAQESINDIPEVLWDDPNLLIGIVSFEEDGASIAIIRIPEYIEKAHLEPINKDNGDE